ncbi:variable surface lipoprotein [Mycoplasmopsis bovis]|nr:variable surface lipoprotein [Mycoplasmopsis bovis]
MKKSKFLLLGSVASLASIPFVAAKCGETKEEKKTRGKNQAEKKTLREKNPGENTEPDKNPGGDKNPGEKKPRWKHRAKKSRWNKNPEKKPRWKHRARQKSRCR